MNRHAPRLPSPAMIVACIALVLALTGVGYAAAVLPSNSVGTPQLRKGAVSATKLKKGSVTPAALSRKSLEVLRAKSGASGPMGPKGEAGPQGPQGPEGEPGDPAQLAAGAVTPKHLSGVPTVRVFSDVPKAVPNTQQTHLAFEGEDHDRYGMHDPATPERLKAPIAGVYSITSQITFSPAAGGLRVLRVVKPGLAVANSVVPSFGASEYTYLDIATQVRLAAGEEIGIQAYQSSGTSLFVTPTNQKPYTTIHAAMTWIAP